MKTRRINGIANRIERTPTSLWPNDKQVAEWRNVVLWVWRYAFTFARVFPSSEDLDFHTFCLVEERAAGIWKPRAIPSTIEAIHFGLGGGNCRWLYSLFAAEWFKCTSCKGTGNFLKSHLKNGKRGGGGGWGFYLILMYNNCVWLYVRLSKPNNSSIISDAHIFFSCCSCATWTNAGNHLWHMCIEKYLQAGANIQIWKYWNLSILEYPSMS